MMILLFLFCSISTAFAASSSSSSSSFSSSSSSSSPQKFSPGPCPHLVADPIDYYQYAGPWYEVQRSANNDRGLEKCILSSWSKPVNNVSLVVHNSYSNRASRISTTVSDVVQDERATAFVHHYPTVGDVYKQYFALGTNYDQYTIVWACDNFGNNHIERAWVFSREPEQPENIENWKLHAFSRYNLTVPEMVYHDFSDCHQIISSYNANSIY